MVNQVARVKARCKTSPVLRPPPIWKFVFTALLVGWLGCFLLEAHQVTSATAKAMFDTYQEDQRNLVLGFVLVGILIAGIVCDRLFGKENTKLISICVPAAAGLAFLLVNFAMKPTGSGIDYLVEFSMDITESSDPALNDQISPEQAALTYLQEAVALKFDEEEFRPEFSSLNEADVENKQGVTRLYTTVEGNAPVGSKNFFLHVLPTAQVAVVMVTFKNGKQGRRANVMLPGEYSNPITLLETADPTESLSFYQAMRLGASKLFTLQGQAAVLIFVILLYSLRFGQTLTQQAAFVLAAIAGHAICAAFGSPIPGDATLTTFFGATIMLIAIDNCLRSEWSIRRLMIVGLAGAITGLCTRDALAETQIQTTLGFYLGWLGAMALVLGLTWVAIGAFWKVAWHRNQLIIPTSFLIIGVGAYWTFRGIVTLLG